MASFSADILLQAKSEGVERAIRGIESNLNRVQRATATTFDLDRKILGVKRELIGAEGAAATAARGRLREYQLQRQEIALQARELRSLETAERRIARERRAGASAIASSLVSAPRDRSNNNGAEGAAALAGLAAYQQAGTTNTAVTRLGAELQAALRPAAQLETTLGNVVGNTIELTLAEQDRSGAIARATAAQQDYGRALENVRFYQEQIARAQNGLQGVFRTGSNASLAQLQVQLEGAETRLRRYSDAANDSYGAQVRAEAAADMLGRSLTIQQEGVQRTERAVRDLTRAQDGLARSTETASNAQRTQGQRPQGGTLKAAGAGLAFSNIPGQNIAQAAGAGALVAGPKGAIVAGIVATGAAATEAGAKIATWTANIERSRIALQGVSGSLTDYTASIDAVAAASDRFNIPLQDATEQYTRLRASMAASGFSAAETTSVFNGLVAANKALGGNSEKLNGILLATSQVFSKGKVTAEELRGQIGERLPGAVAAFAAATGRSTAELDKALEKGEVSLADFVKFAEAQGAKYGKTADVIAKSSEDAGARLQNAWEKLKTAIGPLLKSIGAAFQDFATSLVTALTPAINKINDLLGLSRKAQNDQLYNVRGELAKKEKELAGIPQGRFISQGLRDTEGRLIGAGIDIRARLESEIAQLRKEEARLVQALKPASVGTGKPDAPKPNTAPTGPSKDELRTQSELRDLAIQQAELEGKLGQIGLDRISQLVRQKEVAKELLGLQKADILAEGGPLAEPRMVLAGKEYLLTIKQIDEELQGVADDLYDISVQGNQLRIDLLGGQLAATETPLQAAIRAVNTELAAADKQALELLKKVDQLGGTSPATANARGILGNLRGDIAETDPNKLASQRLTQGDSDNLAATNRQLEQQIAALRQGRTEVSGLQELIARYGADWANLDPAVKGHLVNLQRVNDSLSTQLEKLQQVRADAEALSGITINGIQDALVASVTGGDVRAAFSNLFSQLGDQFLTMAFRPIGEILSREIAKLLGLALVDSTQTAAVATNTGAVAALTPAVVGQTSATVANTAAVTANTAALTAQAGGNAASAVGGLGDILGNLGGLFGGSTAGLGAAASGVAFNPIAFTPGLSFFAKGGIVTGPTNAIIGEAGPEAVIPLNRMGEAMQRFNPGRAEAGRTASADGSVDSAGASLPPVLNITTGPVLNFEGKNYVSRTDFQQGLLQASKQGAAMGESRTLRKLQHSAVARRNLGMA